MEPRPNQDISGIPEPQLVSSPDAPWRSRLTDAVWEVNEAHPDYVALRGEPRARMRYLLALLAKEIVLYSAGRGDLAEPLESLVEVLAHAERNLGSESPRRNKTESNGS